MLNKRQIANIGEYVKVDLTDNLVKKLANNIRAEPEIVN